MPKLRRVNIEESEKIFEDLKDLAQKLKERFNCDVYLYGSFAENKIHEGSDIDLIVVGDFNQRFFERIGKILEMTDLPVEPLAYTREEFEEMRENSPFIRNVLKNAQKLV